MSETGAVAEIRAAIENLPQSAGIVIEDHWGQKYTLVKAFAVGAKTDDPGLVLQIVSAS